MTAKSLYDAGQMDILSCVDTVIDSDSYYTVVFELFSIMMIISMNLMHLLIEC